MSPETPIPEQLRGAALRKYVEEVTKVHESNIEAYDKAILTLSSGFLAVSIAFIKDIAHPPIVWPCLLYWSWALFCLAIISTVGTYALNQIFFDRAAVKMPEYFLRDDKSALQDTVLGSKIISALNLVNGAAFVAGVICTLIFAIKNFDGHAQIAQPHPVLSMPAHTVSRR